MADIARIRANLKKMIDKGAPEGDLDEYLRIEGVTLDQVRSGGVEIPEAARDTTYLSKMTRRVGDVLSFGLMDEATAGVTAAGRWAGKKVMGQPADFGKEYDRELAVQRKLLDIARRDTPYIGGAAEFVGGATFAPGRAVQAAQAAVPTIRQALGQASKIGAGFGAAYGFGSGEGVENRVTGGISHGIAAAILSPLFVGGLMLGGAGVRGIQGWRARRRQPVVAEREAALRDFRDAGVPEFGPAVAGPTVQRTTEGLSGSVVGAPLRERARQSVEGLEARMRETLQGAGGRESPYETGREAQDLLTRQMRGRSRSPEEIAGMEVDELAQIARIPDATVRQQGPRPQVDPVQPRPVRPVAPDDIPAASIPEPPPGYRPVDPASIQMPEAQAQFIRSTETALENGIRSLETVRARIQELTQKGFRKRTDGEAHELVSLKRRADRIETDIRERMDWLRAQRAEWETQRTNMRAAEDQLARDRAIQAERARLAQVQTRQAQEVADDAARAATRHQQQAADDAWRAAAQPPAEYQMGRSPRDTYKTEFDAAYRQADALVDPPIQRNFMEGPRERTYVDPTQTRILVDQLAQEGRRMGVLPGYRNGNMDDPRLHSYLRSRLGDQAAEHLSDLLQRHQSGKFGLVVRGLRDIRTDVGRSIGAARTRDPMRHRPADVATLERLYGAMTEDMQNFLRSAGHDVAAGAYRSIDRAYAEFMGPMRQVLGPLFRDGTRAEQVTQRLLEAAQGRDLNLLRQFYRVVGDKGDQAATTASLLYQMTREGIGRFLEHWNALAPEARDIMFGGTARHLRTQFERFARIAQRLQRFEEAARAQGGWRGVDMTRVPNLLLGASLFMNVQTALMGLGGGALMARFMASPRFVHWLTRVPQAGARGPQHQAWTAHMNRLRAIAVEDIGLQDLADLVSTPARAEEPQGEGVPKLPAPEMTGQ